MRVRVGTGAVLFVVMATTLVVPSAAAVDSCYPISEFLPRAETTLHGDVNGDGSSDTVRTEATWRDDGTCRAWLIVETGKGVFRQRIRSPGGTLVAPPGLAGLVQVRRGPGLDVAVVVWLGASTGFVDVYGLRGRGLHRLSDEAYGYAGSVGNRSGVDCARNRGSSLVVSTAWVDRRERYRVLRMFLAFRSGTFVSIARLTERYRVPFGAIDRFPEFESLVPFPSCTVVPGSS